MDGMDAARLELVEYIDLSQYQNVGTNSFFSDPSMTICTLYIVGWVLDVEIDGIDLLKILYIHDCDGGDNSEGMIIPACCVTNRTTLDPRDKVDSITEDMN